MLNLLKQLESLELAGDETRLESAVETICRRERSRGLVVLVSDFLDRSGFQAAVDRLRYHQFEIYLLQVFAPEEASPDLRGDIEMFDVETQQVRNVTVRAQDLKRYRERFQQFLESLQAYARQHGVGYIGTSTQVTVEDLMLRMMRRAGWLLGPSS